jgi:murein DD-endopeptidase MepM/ murein hydrolase activator NlpD
MGLDRRNGLSPVSQYKAFEKKLASRVKKGFKSFFSKVGGFFQNLYQFGKQQFTIMLIPHSEKSIINLKVNMFFLMVLGVLAMTGVGILLYQTFIDIDSSQSRLVLEHQTEIQQSKLELFQNDINDLEPTLRQFEKVFTETLDVIGIESDLSGEVSNDRRGDLQDLFSYAEAEADTPREIGQIRAIKTLLEESIDPLIDISRVIEAQKNLIVDIPTLWPLKNGQGWPTFYFGPAIHPFTGQWYMHKGFDIAARRGTPVVATANGKVISAEYHRSYGNLVTIQHKYGFQTRYAHMDRMYVTKGANISQGDTIGSLGNTGLSTGPHLHYEVYIGTQLVDPAKYLNITSTVVNR